jgi:GDPmannose 4,6-dehydratase
VAMLVGDATKARRVLGWQPTVFFPELVAMMVESDLRAVAADLPPTVAAEPR